MTSSQAAKCTAQNLWDKFIVHYGLPEKILTDQGCNFDSDLLKELCNCAYNYTRNNVAGFYLYFLMFGRKPHLPIDILFGTNTADLRGNSSTYIENLK